MISLDRNYLNQDKLSGIIEIDETKIRHQKYNRGRMVEGTWLFGMISREGGGFRLEICPNNVRDGPSLLALLEKHVERGSTIMSDGWAAYNCLEEAGNLHLTVIHEENYVDPLTFCHTQTIESNWRAFKTKLCRGGVPKDSLAMHLCE